MGPHSRDCPDQETYGTLVDCCEHHLAVDGDRTPHLLGIAVANLRQRVEGGPQVPLLEQQSTIRWNSAYHGAPYRRRLAGPWRSQVG